jgi:zinc protease
VLSTQFPKALEIVADLVRHPTFKNEEIQRLRSQVLDDMRVSLEEPGTVARYAAAKVIFGDQPYGHSASGTPESIERMGREAIVKLHATYYRPSNAILVLSGNITLEQGVELARKNFGDWRDPAEPLPEVKQNAAVPQSRRVVAIDMAGSGQAAVMMGKTGINRVSKDYFPGEVANGVLGGGYSSRLNEEIRVKRGLTYGAGSMLDARRLTGEFVASAQTKNQSAAEVASLMVAELTKLAERPVDKEELTTRKAALVGEFARHFETNEGIASKVAQFELYGLSVDSANSYIDSVEAVTSGEVQSFAKKYMQADQSSIIIAGEVKAFREPLLKAFKNVEFISKDELDLNEASLKRTPGTK